MSVLNRYGRIASEIYDLDKPPGRLPDTALHLQRLAGLEGPVLEPACGSGRTLLALLEAGFDACGFDPSAEMLARCRSLCAASGFEPDLSMQRFEDFHYARRFAAILVPVGSFNLVDRFDAALATLRRFHDHLQPGGRLILDIQGLGLLAQDRPDRRRWTAPNGDLLTLEGLRVTTDWNGQRSETAYRYERWRDLRLVESELEIMVMRFWGRDEFRLALQEAGFTVVESTGGRGAVWTVEARRGS